MNKRLLLAGLTSLPFFATLANAAGKAGTYIVPKNVTLIRVRSTVDGKEVLDTNFRVVPGQKFMIEAVEDNE